MQNYIYRSIRNFHQFLLLVGMLFFGVAAIICERRTLMILSSLYILKFDSRESAPAIVGIHGKFIACIHYYLNIPLYRFVIATMTTVGYGDLTPNCKLNHSSSVD